MGKPQIQINGSSVAEFKPDGGELDGKLSDVEKKQVKSNDKVKEAVKEELKTLYGEEWNTRKHLKDIKINVGGEGKMTGLDLFKPGTDGAADDEAGEDSNALAEAASWVGKQLGLAPDEEGANPKPKTKGKGKGKTKQAKAAAVEDATPEVEKASYDTSTRVKTATVDIPKAGRKQKAETVPVEYESNKIAGINQDEATKVVDFMADSGRTIKKPADVQVEMEGETKSLEELQHIANGGLGELGTEEVAADDASEDGFLDSLGKTASDFAKDLFSMDPAVIERRIKKKREILAILIMMIMRGSLGLINEAMSLIAQLFGEQAAKTMVQMAKVSDKMLAQRDKLEKERATLLASYDRKKNPGKVQGRITEIDSEIKSIDRNFNQVKAILSEVKTDADSIEESAERIASADRHHRRTMASIA